MSKKSLPKRARAIRMSPEKRRQLLLEAGLKVFADKGISKANHTDVALQAGVSVPTTFHYFSTSEELSDAVLSEVHRFLLEDIVAPHLNDNLQAPASIENILLEFYNAIDSHYDYIRVWFEWSVSVRDGLWDSYLKFYAGALGGIAQILERGRKESSISQAVDTDVASRVIVGLAHMIVQMKFAGNPKSVVVHTIHSLLTQYLGAPVK